MTTDEFVQLLSGVQKTGKGYRAKCPAHEDHVASLAVDPGRGGRVLLHCHAGCSAREIVAVLGKTMADLMPPREVRERRRAIPADRPSFTRAIQIALDQGQAITLGFIAQVAAAHHLDVEEACRTVHDLSVAQWATRGCRSEQVTGGRDDG